MVIQVSGRTETAAMLSAHPCPVRASWHVGRSHTSPGRDHEHRRQGRSGGSGRDRAERRPALIPHGPPSRRRSSCPPRVSL